MPEVTPDVATPTTTTTLNRLKGIIPFTVAAFAGALIPLSMSPWEWWPIGIAATAVLAFLLFQAPTRTAFLLSLCFGFGQFGVGASWVFVSINGYGEVPLPLALIMTGLFVSLLAVAFAAPFALLGYFSHHKASILVGFAGLWVVAEWLRTWLFTGFPWLFLGYGHIDSWFAGWGPVIGAQGISWVIAFIGAALACLARRTYNLATATITAIAVITLLAGGISLRNHEWTQPTGEPLNIGMIQPALTLEQKWDRQQLLTILDLYQEMNEQLLDNDLIVWPESAIPMLKHKIEHYLGETARQVAANDAALILGIPSKNLETNQYFNSIMATGLGEGIYHKQRLVPFGEYVPFEELIRGTLKFFDLPMSSFSLGQRNQQSLLAKGYQVGAYICYEIAYASLVAESAGAANLLLTVSNDTWFGGSIGPNQHLQIAQMRALENGKPLIRTTNDGLSALVDHRGKLLKVAPQFERTTLEGSLTPRTGSTPYNHLGNWPIYGIALFSLLMLLLRRQND